MSEPQVKITQFGFTWGPMVVERTAEVPSGAVVIRVNDLQIYVSPKGRRVRVFRGRKELL